MSVFLGMVTEASDGGKLLLDYPKAFAAFYKRFAGHEIELLIRKRRTARSAKANAALHACLDRWAKDKGHDVEQLKDDLLALRWGYIVRQNILTGEIIKSLVKPHTSKLTTVEFTEIFELAAEEAAKDGHVMEMPDEFKARKLTEQKAAARARGRRAA